MNETWKLIHYINILKINYYTMVNTDVIQDRETILAEPKERFWQELTTGLIKAYNIIKEIRDAQEEMLEKWDITENKIKYANRVYVLINQEILRKIYPQNNKK